MSLTNGQPANQTTFNNAFASKSAENTLAGKQNLSNTDPASGTSLTNIQREMNKLNSFLGSTPNTAENTTPTWTSNDVGVSTNSVKARADLLSAKFNESTGHAHSGVAGDGGPIDAGAIQNVTLKGYVIQGADIVGVTGSSSTVTSSFTGQTPSTNQTTEGVVVNAPSNKVIIRQASGASEDDTYLDGSGNIVYGRLTESSGVWTLSYFTDISGTETAYSFGSASDVRYYYQELFNPLSTTNPPPVYSEFASIPSDSATQDVLDASPTQRGLITTGTQSFAGNKTHGGTQTFSEVTFHEKQINALEITTPSNPAAGRRLLYPKSDGFYEKDSAGVETKLGGGTLTYASINGQTALTDPANDDEILIADTSGTALRKITRLNFKKVNPTTRTTGATLTAADEFQICDATSGVFTLTLPAVSGNAGLEFEFVKTDSTFNQITVDGNASETINGALTRKLSTQNEYFRIRCTGTAWVVVNHYIPSSASSYSPSPRSTGTAGTYGGSNNLDALWQRVGGSAIFTYAYEQGAAGTDGTGIYFFDIPTGMSIGTVDGTNNALALGDGYYFNGTNEFDCFVRYGDANGFHLTRLSGGAYASIGPANTGGYSDNPLRIGFQAIAPIDGWEG